MSKPHNEYSQFTINQYEDLTGLKWEDAEDDTSGTYFSRDHWVSGASIAEALKAVEDHFEEG